VDEISTAKISSICDDSTIVLDSTVEARGATPTPIPTQAPWKPPPVVAKTNSGKVIPATTAWQREDSGLSLCLPFLCNDSTGDNIVLVSTNKPVNYSEYYTNKTISF
jgi:hypothetical protein